MRNLLFAATVSIFAIPAHAQEQTVENAQKFLAMTLPGNEYFPGGFYDGVDKAQIQEPRFRSRIDGHGIIVDASSLSHCRSKVIFDMSQTKAVAWIADHFNTTNRTVPNTNIWGDDPGHVGWKEGFSWGKMKGIEAHGTRVDIIYPGISHESSIYLNDEKLAKRVAYAMEFLRMSCDPTASTGF